MSNDGTVNLPPDSSDAASHQRELAVAAIAALTHFVNGRGNPDTALHNAEACMSRLIGEREIAKLTQDTPELGL